MKVESNYREFDQIQTNACLLQLQYFFIGQHKMIDLQNSNGTTLFFNKECPSIIQDKLCIGTNYLFQNYQNILREYREAFSSSKININTLKEYNISLATKEDFEVLNSQQKNRTEKDCHFSIVKTYNYGLQYTYDVLMGPFKLRILILNIHCCSGNENHPQFQSQFRDSNQYNISQEFIEEKSFIIKRILLPLSTKSDDSNDLGINTKQRNQFRHCLRQYCIHKICSLVGVGPNIVKSNYDAICFKNCIQFKMELCQTLLELKQQQKLSEKLQANFIENFAIMHSLGLIHSNIRLENVVYSSKARKFVFSNFQMAFFSRESLEVVCKLQEIEKRQPLDIHPMHSNNFYLNDYYSLLRSIDRFQTAKANAITSYLKNNEDLDDNLFQKEKQSLINDQSQQITYISFVPLTRAPQIAITQTKVKKGKSQSIHHDLANVVYDLCRKKQNNAQITTNLRNKVIINQGKKGKYTVTQILQQFNKELVHYFNQYCGSQILCVIKQWKNTLRHHYRSDRLTINMLDTIISKADESQIQKLKIFKEQLQCRNEEMDDQQVNLIILRLLSYFRSHPYSLIQLIKLQINQERYDSSTKKRRSILFAREHLFCVNNFTRMGNHQQNLIVFVSLYFKDSSNQQSFDLESIQVGVVLFNFCFKYLINCKAARPSDLQMFVNFYLNYYAHSSQKIKAIEQCGILLQQYNNCSRQMQIQRNMDPSSQMLFLSSSWMLSVSIKTSLASLYFRILESNPIFSNQAFSIMEQFIIQLPSQSEQNLKIQINLAVCYCWIKQFVKSVDLLQKIYEQLQKFKIDQHKRIYYSSYIFYCISQALRLACRFQLSLQYSALALQYLQLQYELHHQNNFQYKVRSMICKSQVLLQLKKYKDCIEEISKAIDIFKNISKSKLVRLKIDLLILLNHVFLKKGISRQEQDTYVSIIQIMVRNLHIYYTTEKESFKGDVMLVKQQGITKINFVFFFKQMLKQIKPPSHPYFIKDYQLINYRLSKYYLREVKHLNEGLKYLWRYIDSRRENSVLLEEDYQMMNMFVEYLMLNNSFRRAIIFMKKYIFMVPSIYLTTRKKAFRLMCKAQTEMGDKMAKIYCQLTKNDCKILTTNNFQALIVKENREKHRRKLLEKWLLKL